jgi:hypothetical protein
MFYGFFILVFYGRYMGLYMGFYIGCMWSSMGFYMCFMWSSMGFYVGFIWVLCGLLWVLYEFLYRFYVVFSGFLYVFLYGFYVVFYWFVYWFLYGFFNGFYRCYIWHYVRSKVVMFKWWTGVRKESGNKLTYVMHFYRGIAGCCRFQLHPVPLR